MIQDCFKFLSESWQDRPGVVVLSVVALVALVFFLVDTHRHRRKYKKQHPDKHQHKHEQQNHH